MIPITDFSVVVLPAPCARATSPPRGVHLEIDAVKDVRLPVPGFEIPDRKHRRARAGRRCAIPRYGFGHFHFRHDLPQISFLDACILGQIGVMAFRQHVTRVST